MKLAVSRTMSRQRLRVSEGGVLAVVEFGIVEGVGLLPDEEGADGGRGVGTVGTEHFGPAAPWKPCWAARSRAESRILA